MAAFRSIKFRLTVLYAGIFAGFLIAFSAAIYVPASNHAWRDFDRDLDRDADAFSSLVVEEWKELQEGSHKQDDWLDEVKPIPGLLQSQVTLIGADGKIVFRTPELSALPPPSKSATGWRTEYLALEHHPGHYRIVTKDLSRAGPPLVVEFSRSTVHLSRFLHRMALGLILGIPLLVGFAFLAGYFFIRRTIRPVVEMADLAREISAGDLARRVPLPSSEGEFKQLAITLNGMLSRLEEAFARMRTFTSNSAHELRTPVASIRTALETALGRSTRELEESIRDGLEELQQLTAITEKLLLLSRADAGRLLGEIRPVDLAAISHQVAAAFEIPASQRGIAIHVEGGPARAPADAALLRRAIHN